MLTSSNTADRPTTTGPVFAGHAGPQSSPEELFAPRAEANAAGIGHTLALVASDASDEQLLGALRDQRFRVVIASDLASTFDHIGRYAPQVVVLSRSLPGGDAFDVLRSLGSSRDGVPIIVIAARYDEVEHAVALELGADDYLRGDISPHVVAARLRASVRRRATAEKEARGHALSSSHVEFGGLELDRATCQARWGPRTLDLSSVSFDTLFLLAIRAPTLVTRGEIFARLYRQSLPIGSRQVDMYILRLRKQLQEQGASGIRVTTVRHRGFRLELVAAPPS